MVRLERFQLPLRPWKGRSLNANVQSQKKKLGSRINDFQSLNRMFLVILLVTLPAPRHVVVYRVNLVHIAITSSY